MIRIRRPNSVPDPKTAELLDRGKAAVHQFKEKDLRQQRFDFSQRFFGRAKEILTQIQHSKCAYCESRVGLASQGNLNTFWPKSKFPDRAYDWNNLLVVCSICGANKRDQFPVDRKGRPLLVDPAEEEPSDSIEFDESGTAFPKNEKGETTIKILALNRSELVAERGLAIKSHLRKNRDVPDEVLYAGAIRSARWSRTSGRGKERLVATEIKKSTRHYGGSVAASAVISTKQDFSYISSVRIRNFRAIQDLELNFVFTKDQPGWQVLLGENAAGKSTVLKAVAMVLMGSQFLEATRDYQKGILRRYKQGDEVRHATSGSVAIKFVNGQTAVMKLGKKGPKFVGGEDGMGGTIRGYGSMRLLPENDEESIASAGSGDVGNLFHPRQTLVNAEKLLIGFYDSNRPKFELFAKHIKHLLRLDEPLDVVDNELLIPINGTPVRIAELSDGFQAMIALAVDLMNGFPDSEPMESAPGILILDELGTHLHPRWRLEFVTRLRETFEGLQVISTTHEPLCLRGLKKGEVGLIRRDSDGNVEFVGNDELPSIEGMRVDQILTSPIFGLNSTIDSEVEAKFVRYYELLAKHGLASEEDFERKALARDLKPHRHLAYTRRDQMMYDVIDQFLAEDAGRMRLTLNQESMDKLRGIWEESGIPGMEGVS